MKTVKFIAFSLLPLFAAQLVSAQTADEIAAKYIEAIGGRDRISKVNTLYTEGTLDVMGGTGSIKHTLLAGKGSKSEIDVQGTSVTMCITDSSGWMINSMTGNYNAEYMSAEQYNASRDEIFIGGSFGNFANRGYKMVPDGQLAIGEIQANKVLVTSPDSVTIQYFFDPATGFMIQAVLTSVIGSQVMDITYSFSDYRKMDAGIAIPYKIETNYGGQFILTETVTKADVNQPVDPVVFAKP